jgi:predicted RNA-binding Zn-ribbon protein involved in translation (DUF1610 family)
MLCPNCGGQGQAQCGQCNDTGHGPVMPQSDGSLFFPPCALCGGNKIARCQTCQGLGTIADPDPVAPILGRWRPNDGESVITLAASLSGYVMRFSKDLPDIPIKISVTANEVEMFWVVRTNTSGTLYRFTGKIVGNAIVGERIEQPGNIVGDEIIGDPSKQQKNAFLFRREPPPLIRFLQSFFRRPKASSAK